jgi:hypothetical protein
MNHRRRFTALPRRPLAPVAALAWAGLVGCATRRPPLAPPAPTEVVQHVLQEETAPPLLAEPDRLAPRVRRSSGALPASALRALVFDAIGLGEAKEETPKAPAPEVPDGLPSCSEVPREGAITLDATGAVGSSELCAWLLSVMVWKAPPEKYAALPQFPGWKETAGERLERYRSIAADLAAVVLDPDERMAYRGARSRERTAALLLALAFMESGFAKDVDKGPCYRGRDGTFARCDGGLSACMLQIRVGAGTTSEGWSREELFADRRKCFRAALHKARRAMSSCVRRGPDALLNAYASGSCDRGLHESRERLAMARRFFDRRPAP